MKKNVFYFLTGLLINPLLLYFLLSGNKASVGILTFIVPIIAKYILDKFFPSKDGKLDVTAAFAFAIPYVMCAIAYLFLIR